MEGSPLGVRLTARWLPVSANPEGERAEAGADDGVPGREPAARLGARAVGSVAGVGVGVATAAGSGPGTGSCVCSVFAGTRWPVDAFEIGVYNVLGVHSRTLDEGGNQERKPSAKYHALGATACLWLTARRQRSGAHCGELSYEWDAERKDSEVRAIEAPGERSGTHHGTTCGPPVTERS